MREADGEDRGGSAAHGGSGEAHRQETDDRISEPLSRDSLYLKNFCEIRRLGEIYYAKAHALRRRAVPTWGVFLDEEKQGGGPLIDIGTHALDLTLWMMDNYKPKVGARRGLS